MTARCQSCEQGQPWWLSHSVACLLAALHATTRNDQATRLPETTPEPDRKDDQ